MDFKSKAEQINLVLSEPDVDLWKLRELALTEGGLVNDTLRRRAWPKLVGVHAMFTPNEKHQSSPTTTNASSRPPRSSAGRPPRPGSSTPKSSGSSSQLATPPSPKQPPPMSPSRARKLRAAAGPAIPDSIDAEQIARDVARCTWHLLTGSQRSRKKQMNNKHRRKVAYILRKKQKRLGNFLNLTLLKTYEDGDGDKLCYYQGYHDVASIFLCTLGGSASATGTTSMGDPASVAAIASAVGLDLPRAVLAQISFSHFRDAMQSNFMQLQTAIKLLLMPLICYFDPEMHDFLYACEMEPYFALSWIITWFSHDIRDTALVKRIFDAFIVSHPLLPIYATVAMVCHHYNRAEVLNVECDFSTVHSTLANLPKNSSMVGWRYRPTGDGYESGDESDGDAGSVATMEISFALDSQPFESRDDDDVENHSMVSSQISSLFSKAPFEEILEDALSFMRRIPPSRLMSLATRYHAAETMEPMLSVTPTIVLLKPHPKWGLVSSRPSDWVLKQRARQREKDKSGKRRRTRSRSRSRSRTRTSPVRQGPPPSPRSNGAEETSKFLAEQRKNLAVIACGFGSGDEEEYHRRKRKRLLFWSTVAVGVVAVSVGLFLNSGSLIASEGGGQRQQKLEVSTTSSTARKLSIPLPLMKSSDNTAAESNVKTKGISSVPYSKVEIVPAKEMMIKQSTMRAVPVSIANIMKEPRPGISTDGSNTIAIRPERYNPRTIEREKVRMENVAITIVMHAAKKVKQIIKGTIQSIAGLFKTLRQRRYRDL